MTSLLCRISIFAGIALFGFTGMSQAQDTVLVAPDRSTVLRRAPLPAAPAPLVQQSPNGQYKLSITDTGIELLGPAGMVKISATGIEIGSPSTTSVSIRSNNVEVKSGQAVRLESGSNMDIRAGSNLNLRGSSAVEVRGDNGASLTGSVVKLGCGPTTGKPAARIADVVNTSATPAVIAQGSPTVQVC